jgi:hypothetical protein
MPESVTDRPTKSHEYIFLLSKSADYFYDMEAIKEPHVRLWDESNGGGMATTWHDQAHIGGTNRHERPYPLPNPAGRNKRTVWTVATQPYPDAHFATFPEDLIAVHPERHITARGMWSVPWERVVEKSGGTIGQSWHNHDSDQEKGQRSPNTLMNSGWLYQSKTLAGNRPATTITKHEHVPASPPFAGSGTTVKVAQDLGRIGIGLNLKPTI